MDSISLNASNGGVSPELYAPGTWNPGSSYSHLDETVYGEGDPDSLMTAFLASGEAIHDPGQITLGMFADMGWMVDTGTIFVDGFESGDTTSWSSVVQ